MLPAATSPTIAIDVAILPPEMIARRCRGLNAQLEAPPNGFRFDETHLPHVTLVQQFIAHDDVGGLAVRIGRALEHQPPLRLQTTTLSRGATAATLEIASHPELGALHHRVADLVHPLAVSPDGAAFVADDAEPRPADIDWVASFEDRSSYQRFAPHITLGVGALHDATLTPWSFVAQRIALCQLGRFCTCRSILASWTLTAPR